MRVVACALLIIASTYAGSPPLRERREVNESAGRCEPGKSFKRYCNTCICSNDGLVEHSACTLMGCAPNVRNSEGTQNIRAATAHDVSSRNERDTEELCEPGKSFKHYCNTCVCSNDGLVSHSACTLMGCEPNVWNRDGTLKDPSKIVKKRFSRKVREFKRATESCTLGESFQHYCNTCSCMKFGSTNTVACTLMACDPNVWNEDGSRKIPARITNDVTSRKERGTEELCEPGQSFKRYCNTCVCGADGKVELSACTRKGCSPDVWNKDGSRKIPATTANDVMSRKERGTEELCEPGQSFKLYCNTCVCGADGKVELSACTRKGCSPDVWNKDGSRRVASEVDSDTVVSSRQQRDTEDTCEPGKPFMDSCNTCFCGDDGKLENSVCTKMFCGRNVWRKNEFLWRERREAGDRCEPGRSFRHYCNSCRCARDGTIENSACTLMYCDPDVWNKDGSRKNAGEIANNYLLRLKREAGDRCEPGTSFKHYCNTCRCGSDGRVEHSGCTLMYCNPDVWNRDGSKKIPNEGATTGLRRYRRSTEFLCQPGKSFKNDCNSCFCEQDGKSSICTLRLCTPRDASLIPAPQVCEPGKRFKIDCNQCICSEDGLRVGCTKIDCPPAK